MRALFIFAFISFLGHADQPAFKIIKVEAAYIHTTPKTGLADWYRANLGLNLKTQFGDQTWLETDFEGQPSRFAVDLRGKIGGMSDQPVVLSFQVDHIDPAVAHMQKNGVIFLNSSKPIERTPWGATATFQDKDGNWMQLVQKN